MRRWAALGFLCTALAMGCQHTMAPTDHQEAVLALEYVGNETVEDVLRSLPLVEEALGVTITPEERHSILANASKRGVRTSTSAYCAVIACYGWTWHYVPPTDADVYLEYKWRAGSRRPYTMFTTSQALYDIIRTRYQGRLLTYSWMEGAHQRVTAVAGAHLWASPYASPGHIFLRNHIFVGVTG